MPNWPSLIVLGALAAAYWTALGLPIARRVVPAGVQAAAAPALGWCVHTSVLLTVLRVVPFGRWVIVAVSLVLLAVAWVRCPAADVGDRGAVRLCVPAGLVALLVAAAVLPHGVGAGLSLSLPIFDHSKIAIVDGIARSGLPPGNFFYGGTDAGAHLTYYWWWHGSAALLARAVGVSGWSAEAALSGFTGWASLMLMGGIAARLGGGGAAVVALLISLPASLRAFTFPLERAGWLLGGKGLGGWLNQTSWAPQHMAAALALTLGGLILAGLATTGWAGVVALACVVAAGFGSSAWVGGVACAVALPICGLALLRRTTAPARLLVAAGAAGGLAILLVAGLLLDEWAGAVRRGGHTLAIVPYAVFGRTVPGSVRPWADLAGFPLLLLVEFPAIAIFAVPGVVQAWRRGLEAWQAGLLALGAGCLLVMALLRSTIDNNDLGWRAAAPALVVFTPFAAAATWRWVRSGGFRLGCAVLPSLLGARNAWPMLRDNVAGDGGRADPAFVASLPAWAALRAVSAPDERVAVDPGFTRFMTLWPVNIGWALLSDRPSCYAGWGITHALTPLTSPQVYRVELILDRVFAGTPGVGDLASMAGPLHCRYALLLPGDPAWTHDPFAATSVYRLVSAAAGWRIYRATTP